MTILKNEGYLKSGNFLCLTVWLCFAMLWYFASTGVSLAKGAPESFAPLAERLLPAVVNISTTQNLRRENKSGTPTLPQGSPLEEYFKEFFERQQRGSGKQPRQATSLGSGFVISSDGLIVTNNHVIDGADEISVIFHDNTRLDAKVIGKDKKTDLALLKVKSKKSLPFVRFGNSDRSKVGDWVVFARYAGSRIEIEGGEVRLLNEDEVLATVQDPTDILHKF